jgi:two-component system LytT family sensor kinase
MLQDVFLYWTLVGGIQVYRHRRALARSELVAARLTAELAEARLAALQARLEPHFLFNALNTAVMLVRDDRGEQAVDVLLQLSELLRTVIAGAPGHEVALCDEWTFVERYLTLERVRYGDRLDVRLSLAPGLERVRVPFLVLQPLVENALRHGVARRVDEGPGVVEVVARRDDASLRLEVRDNGPGPAAANGSGDRRGTGSHVGLASVRARLGALYGDRGTLELAGAQGGGMVATIRLPLTAVA